jgi:transcriptional regulator with GAF, ATPase, and Fis domain
MAQRPTKKRNSQVRRDASGKMRDTPAMMPRAGLWAALESDNRWLRDRVGELEAQLEQLRGDLASALAVNDSSETHYEGKAVAAEAYHGDLATLYVASTRLQATLRSEELLAAIREIIVNLIGVEEMAVLKNDPATLTLSLVDAFGNAPGHYLNIALGDHRIRRVVATGDAYFHAAAHGTCAEANTLVACVPLKVNDSVWGVIVIFRLLSHKDRLVALDHQLMDLLSAQAGVALRCSELAAQRAREISA